MIVCPLLLSIANALIQLVFKFVLSENFETLHAVLAEMVVGGVVIETGLEKIVAGVRENEGTKGKRKAVNASSSSTLGRSSAFAGLGWATGTGSGWR